MVNAFGMQGQGDVERRDRAAHTRYPKLCRVWFAVQQLNVINANATEPPEGLAERVDFLS